jgi:HPt (histidine-containing phosphotransfer) domain-containing protein
MSGPSDTDAAEAQLRDQVKILGEKFLVRTASQIVTLREHLASLRGGDPGALTGIQELSHKIHGSGAMFGFATLSEAAGEIERLTVSASGSEVADQLGTLIEQLAAALDATRRG